MARAYDNPKRKLKALGNVDANQLESLAQKVTYGGNPAHKSHRGDFGLTPPSAADPRKTLCDGVQIFRHKVALSLLREGVRRGCISEQADNGWPKHIWAVAEDGTPVEAKLDNIEKGNYHGYPLQKKDSFRESILERWNA